MVETKLCIMTILDHNHTLLKLEDTETIPFEDRKFEYEQWHCQTEGCDYHEFRYLRHDEVVA